MQKYASTGTFYTPLGDAALAASRKVWLAGLGATVVTRNWLESEGGHVFQTLVKQGTVVESRAMRLLGRKVDASLSQANTMWRTYAPHRRSHGQAGGSVGGRLRAASAPEVAPQDRAPEGVRAEREGSGQALHASP